MHRLPLTMSCGVYDRTVPFLTGWVEPEGIELNVVPLSSPERHTRMAQGLEFDICELSMAIFLVGQEHGFPVRAIPVFPHRRFRHSYVFVRSDRVREPRELAGKRVGVPLYMNTTGLWVRGILSDFYGVDLSGVEWVSTIPEEIPGWQPPAGLRLTRVGRETRLEGRLMSGEIDAQIFPDVISDEVLHAPGVARLFPDHQAEEERYFRETGIFPVMHTVVIKQEVLERHPWVATSMYKAWCRAFDWAARWSADQRTSLLVWGRSQLEHERAVFGGTPWKNGVGPNRADLEKMMAYAVDQGLLARRADVDALFLPVKH